LTLPATGLVGTIQPFWVGWIDITGDPVRVTTLPRDVTFTGTGDTDLDGFAFESVPAAFVGVSPVTHQEGGSDTVTVQLSGIPGGDDALLAVMAAPANWRGRTARLWRGLADSNFTPTILEGYYTGYVVSARFSGDATTQTIELQIENYLAALTTPRARTYQHQAEHDALDVSPARIRAAANGMQTATGIAPGIGSFNRNEYQQEQ
jgi:hypothetical protein